MQKVRTYLSVSSSCGWYYICSQVLIMIGVCYFAYAHAFLFVLPCLFLLVMQIISDDVICKACHTVSLEYGSNSKRILFTHMTILKSTLIFSIICTMIIFLLAPIIAKFTLSYDATKEDISLLTNTLRITSLASVCILPIGAFQGIDYTFHRYKDLLKRAKTKGIFQIGLFYGLSMASKSMFSVHESIYIYLAILAIILPNAAILYANFKKTGGMQIVKDHHPNQIKRAVRRSILTGMYDVMVENMWLWIDGILFMPLAHLASLGYDGAKDLYVTSIVGLLIFTSINYILSYLQVSTLLEGDQRVGNSVLKLCMGSLPIGILFICRSSVMYQLFMFTYYPYDKLYLNTMAFTAMFYVLSKLTGLMLVHEKMQGSYRIYGLVGLVVKLALLYPLFVKIGPLSLLLTDALSFLTITFLNISRLHSICHMDVAKMSKKLVYIILASIAGYGGTVILTFMWGIDGLERSYLLVARDSLLMIAAYGVVYAMSGTLLKLWRIRKR